MRLLFLISLVALLILGDKGLAQAAYTYDSDFRPEANGFSFENYGSNVKTVDITQIEMQRLFGERVCATTANKSCKLSPSAEVWMEEANKAMQYGHCEGMAVLSALIYSNQISPGEFGANTTQELLLKNQSLQREIAYWWVTQATEPGRSQIVKESPNAVLDTLIKAFKEGRGAGEWWSMGVYQPDREGGHSITPFAVQNLSNDKAKIMVYDNNFPGTNRSVDIDRKANTWSYQTGINPDSPIDLYSGNASTRSLEVVSIPPRIGLQKCDFCDDSSSGLGGANKTLAQSKHMQLWVDGTAHILVTDEKGQRIGYTEQGNFVNEIPNAEALELKYSNNPGAIRHPPILIVPQGTQLSAFLTGFGQTDDTDLTEIGSNYYVRVQKMMLIPDEQINLATTTSDNDCFSQLLPIFLKSPRVTTLALGVNTPLESLKFTILDAQIEPQGSLGVNQDLEKGTLTFDTNNINSFRLKLLIERVNQDTGNEQIFANYDYKINKNDEIVLYLNSYDGKSYDVEIRNGDKIKKIKLIDNPSLHPKKPDPATNQDKIFSIEQKCPLSSCPF